MKLPRLGPVLLLVVSATLQAQRAWTSGPPAAAAGRPWVATRFLEDLRNSTNGGVLAVEDLNGDGALDLLTWVWPAAFSPPTGIQSWLGDGQGGFQTASLLVFDPWVLSPSDIARSIWLADVTGDGVLDLAYDRKVQFASVPPGVLVHPGLGDGGFGPELFLETNGPPQEFVVGDCDGDGDADLLVHESNTGTDYQNTLQWWHLEGTTFVPGASLLVDAETPLRLRALDLDADGITDAVAGTFSGYDALQVFRTVNGAPTLDAILPLPPEVWNINQRQLVGDIDDDGREDLLLNFEDFTNHVYQVLVFLGTEHGFQAQALQTFDNPLLDRTLTSTRLADWDGDGDLDLVSPTLAWLENTGGAHFERAGHVLSNWNGNTSERAPLFLVDLDRDGHLDALAEWSLFRGNGTFPHTSSAPSWAEYLGLSGRAEDWDGDGDLDVVGPGQLFLNSGNGSFVSRLTSHFAAGSFEQHDVGWNDFDGDGLRDVVTAVFTYPPFQFSRMVLFTGTEDGTYVESPTVPSVLEITSSSGLSGDLDGDGDADLLTESGAWLNDGTGQFSTPVGPYSGVPLVARDADGDDDLDLLVSHAGRLELLRNLGSLAFAITDLGPWSNADTDPPPEFLDVDEDGDLDLVVGEPANGRVLVHETLPGGMLAPPLELLVPGLNGRVGLVDVDGDGRLDLVAPRTVTANSLSTQVLMVWRRGSGASYGAGGDWATLETPKVYGDFDGDGDVEIYGARHFRNLQFDGPDDGSVVQYGLDAATPGTGGRHPLLGSGAPARYGQPARLVVARGRGHAAGVLLAGSARADTVDAGVRVLVQAPQTVRSFVLEGAPGVAGAGSLELRQRVSATLVGRTFDFQAVLVDPGASVGLSATNGLEVHFGGWPAR